MIKIENLDVYFDEKKLLDNINLNIKKKSRHLIKGHNGSGKSTLVNVIMGNDNYKITNGNIFFNDENITDTPVNIRSVKGIFLGAQNVPEIPGLTLISFLKHSMSAHSLYNNNKDILMSDFLTQLKIVQNKLNIPEDWLNRSLNVGFSGGERKKIMLMRLLMIKPKIALLDEPDSGADSNTQKIIADIINNMIDTTFVFISHQENFTKQLNITHTTILENGKIIN